MMWLLWLLGGCSLWGHQNTRIDPAAAAWKTAQQAFARRGEEGGPARAVEALDAAVAANPRNLLIKQGNAEWIVSLCRLSQEIQRCFSVTG